MSRLEQVILVGHSYAGMIICGVAEVQFKSIQRLVFIDAFVPEDGQCVLDLLPSEIGGLFREVAQSQGSGWRLPGGEGQLDLWGLVPSEARDFVRARLCDFSLRCFEEPILLPANRKASIPATYIACTADSYPAKPFFKVFAKRLVLAAGRSRNLTRGTIAMSNAPVQSLIFCELRRNRLDS